MVLAVTTVLSYRTPNVREMPCAVLPLPWLLGTHSPAPVSHTLLPNWHCQGRVFPWEQALPRGLETSSLHGEWLNSLWLCSHEGIRTKLLLDSPPQGQSAAFMVTDKQSITFLLPTLFPGFLLLSLTFSTMPMHPLQQGFSSKQCNQGSWLISFPYSISLLIVPPVVRILIFISRSYHDSIAHYQKPLPQQGFLVASEGSSVEWVTPLEAALEVSDLIQDA